MKNLLSLYFNHFSSNFIKIGILFWFLTDTLTLFVPVACWACDNTDLLSNSNVSKTVNVNIVFNKTV